MMVTSNEEEGWPALTVKAGVNCRLFRSLPLCDNALADLLARKTFRGLAPCYITRLSKS